MVDHCSELRLWGCSSCYYLWLNEKKKLWNWAWCCKKSSENLSTMNHNVWKNAADEWLFLWFEGLFWINFRQKIPSCSSKLGCKQKCPNLKTFHLLCEACVFSSEIQVKCWQDKIAKVHIDNLSCWKSSAVWISIFWLASYAVVKNFFSLPITVCRRSSEPKNSLQCFIPAKDYSSFVLKVLFPVML